MRTAALAVLVALIPAAALEQTAPATCEGVPPPPPVFDYVIDPAPAIYAGPACLEGETCTTPPDWDPLQGARVTAAGLERRYTYAGELRAVERNGRWESEELVMVPTGKPPACWAWEWRPAGY